MFFLYSHLTFFHNVHHTDFASRLRETNFLFLHCVCFQLLDAALRDPQQSQFMCREVVDQYRGFGGVHLYYHHISYSVVEYNQSIYIYIYIVIISQLTELGLIVLSLWMAFLLKRGSNCVSLHFIAEFVCKIYF